MSNDEIIDMAGNIFNKCNNAEVVEFARAVAAKEREACFVPEMLNAIRMCGIHFEALAINNDKLRALVKKVEAVLYAEDFRGGESKNEH